MGERRTRIAGGAWICLLLSAWWACTAPIGQAADTEGQRIEMLRPDILWGIPPGAGPFPVVILLHGCGGRSPEGPKNRENAYREALEANGIAWMSVKSFPLVGRNFTSACGRPPGTIDTDGRVEDLAAVIQDLGRYPQLDARRVGVLGFSMGAATAIKGVMRLDPIRAPGFRSAVALYSGCRDLQASQGILGRRRLLMILGGKDTWAPADRCVSLARELGAGGHDVEAVVFPEGTHQWGNPASAGGRHISMGPGRGTTFVQYDPDLARDSVRRAVAHFRDTLLPGQ